MSSLLQRGGRFFVAAGMAKTQAKAMHNAALTIGVETLCRGGLNQDEFVEAICKEVCKRCVFIGSGAIASTLAASPASGRAEAALAKSTPEWMTSSRRLISGEELRRRRMKTFQVRLRQAKGGPTCSRRGGSMRGHACGAISQQELQAKPKALSTRDGCLPTENTGNQSAPC